MAQIATGRPDPQAAVALEYLKRIKPGSPRQDALVQFFKGKAHYFQKRYDMSEMCWRNALRIDPLVPEAGWALVDLLDLEGRAEEAHIVGMRQHEFEPNPADRVRILLEVSRIDIDKVAAGSIVQNLELLNRDHPENLPIGIALGLGLVHDSHFEQGVAILEDVRKRHPESPEAWDAWLTGLDDAGHEDRLAAELGRLPGSMVSDPRFAKHYGRVAQNERKFDAAVNAYRRAFEATPWDGVVLYKFNLVLGRLGKKDAEARRIEQTLAAFQAAFKDLRGVHREAMALQGLGTAPNTAVYQRLAELREKMGRRDEALAWHRLVLKDSPDDPLSLAAVARLK
jgi:tetratricopeptide (TPR) repeat protein